MHMNLYENIGPGDRVTILVPSGRSIDRETHMVVPCYAKRTGRVVMKGPAGWVLNLGGRYGTPGIATPNNVVAVKKAVNPQDYATF